MTLQNGNGIIKQETSKVKRPLTQYKPVPEPAVRQEEPMGYTDNMSPEMKQRIVQELVPGKQISLAHIIANPDKILYTKLGLDPSLDYSRAAIGIMTVSPAETAIIMADIAMKSSGIELGFVDRFSGSLIITGTVSEVEASTSAILDYVGNKLGFTLCPITRT